MKCSICSEKIGETFLNKIIGSYVKKEGSSKKYSVCSKCQNKFNTKEELVENIK